MNRIRTAVATILLASVVHAAQFPVVAGALTTAGPNSRVQLTNRGDQPVTAWALAVTTPAVDGQSRRFEETIDAYSARSLRDLPGATDKLNRLLPGEGREVQFQAVPPGSSVEIVAVVLQDGTALGDARTIRSIFARRRMERDDLRAVVDVLARCCHPRRESPHWRNCSGGLQAGSNDPIRHPFARRAKPLTPISRSRRQPMPMRSFSSSAPTPTSSSVSTSWRSDTPNRSPDNLRPLKTKDWRGSACGSRHLLREPQPH